MYPLLSNSASAKENGSIMITRKRSCDLTSVRETRTPYLLHLYTFVTHLIVTRMVDFYIIVY